MSNSAKGLPGHEMDTNLLFEKYTVEEIRNIEKRIRADIENKKEDLRTMVGERYRDLIEAADTIAEMKNSALNVMAKIVKIETLCNDLKQSQMVSTSWQQQKKRQVIENQRKEDLKFHEVASQIKLLLDIPEKMWTYLDCEDYLSASRLYLLSQHINTSLQLGSQSTSNFLYWFPVLTKQWAAISHFRSTILQGCRQLIKESKVSSKKIAESLSAIMLLENSNPRQVFHEFLLARTSAIHHLFHNSDPSCSTKDQICLVMRLVTTTINQIYSVFYNQHGTQQEHDEVNLLMTILVKVTTEKQNESGLLDLQSSVSAKCLPKSVTEYCCSHMSVSVVISEQHLHDNCMQWIQTCIDDIKSGVSMLLNLVNTIKHVATIRDTVWKMMAQDNSLRNWSTVCEKVLNRNLEIWDDILRPLFVDRVKSLIKYQLEATAELTQRQIRTVLTELDTPDKSAMAPEIDLASYIWSESPGDIAANTAWSVAGSRSQLDSGGLIMKAKAFTPVVQSFCKNFDEKVQGIVEDYQSYMFLDTENMSVAMETVPFNRFVDTELLLSFVQKSCMECVQSILLFCTKLHTEYKNTLSSVDQKCGTISYKLMLIGRLCAALCELTPYLQQCMMGSEQLNKQDRIKSLMKKSSSARLVGKSDSSSSVWDSVKSQMTQFQYLSYRVWIDHLVAVGLKDFRVAVDIHTPNELINDCARWDEIAIEEETEDGSKISSKISVPVQVSWYLLSLLYKLCGDLNCIGGHTVPRCIIEHLVVNISDGIVKVYMDLLSNSTKGTSTCLINQQRALQMLFDVKFTHMLITRKEDTKENKVYHKNMEEIISKLEEFVDPFDLDVFAPYIQSNLTKLVQRTVILLGAFTSLDKSGPYSLTNRPTANSQEQHNVFLLSTCHNRFSLLPLSVQQSRYSAPQPVPSPSLYRSSDSGGGTSLAETAAAVIPNQSSLQKMTSTSSFYDRIGGLGSMTEISNWFSTIGSK